MTSLSNPVESYYDQNTKRFLKYDPHHDTYGIHREVWGEGVKTPQEAFHFINRLVLELIKNNKCDSILDLGCGVGGTLFYLAQHYLEPNYYGVTLSSSQVQISKKIAQNLDLDDKCVILKGDFENLPSSIPKIDLAYAIEAFVHATNSDAFFRQASNTMENGSLLIICDDFLTESSANLPTHSREYQLINDFRRGWILESLMSISKVQSIASQYGYTLIENINLTPNLNLSKKRDILISLLVPILKLFMEKSFYAKALVGSDAIQKCLSTGLIDYRFLIFRKQ